jgi:hypothetical protein
LSTTWILNAWPPRPTTRPSLTHTKVCKAQCLSKMWAYGTKDPASTMESLATHLAKRLTFPYGS